MWCAAKKKAYQLFRNRHMMRVDPKKNKILYRIQQPVASYPGSFFLSSKEPGYKAKPPAALHGVDRVFGRLCCVVYKPIYYVT